MTTAIEDSKFKEEVIADSLLEDAIQWIKCNLSPDEVFDADILSQWAKDSGFKEAE